MTQSKSKGVVRYLVDNGKVTRLDRIPLPKNFYLATIEVFDPPIPLEKSKRLSKKKRKRS